MEVAGEVILVYMGSFLHEDGMDSSLLLWLRKEAALGFLPLSACCPLLEQNEKRRGPD